MSEFLRHKANNFCRVWPDGTVMVTSTFQYMNERIMHDDKIFELDTLIAVVKYNSKLRLQIWQHNESKELVYVRAVGGHSMSGLNHELILVPVGRGEIPDVIYHGTKQSRLDRIMLEGLLPRGPNTHALT